MNRLSNYAKCSCLVLILHGLILRKAISEDKVDFKTHFYLEDDDRIQVYSPQFLWEHNLNNSTTIRLEGVYNYITGASPSGAPANTIAEGQTVEEYEQEYDDDDDDEGDESDSLVSSSRALSGASQVSARNENLGSLPAQDFNDSRIAVTFGIDKKINNHTIGAEATVSYESDYQSIAGALKHAVELNNKNTVLDWGVSYSHDEITASTLDSDEKKDVIEGIVGITQILSPTTYVKFNFTYGYTDGYLADPYKVVSLNDEIVAESRPGNVDKQVFNIAFHHYFEKINAAVELDYRYYMNSFGINANTVSLLWNQKIGDKLILTPVFRYYQQSAADFYNTSFTGNPENYSSDYRLSKLQTFTFGAEVRYNFDNEMQLFAGYERYIMDGRDSITPSEAYPEANIFSIGISKSF